jgi:predicted nucleotidyltransferase
MDKNDAIELSKNYVDKLRKTGINVLDVWLFGSYAKGNWNNDSDIDLALVLPDDMVSFDTDVKLMVMRKGKETLIETHIYGKNEFQTNLPIILQIIKYGIKLF